jgi:phosphoribosylglycinamide formyltransferase-1
VTAARLAVLVSGGGTNLQALIDGCLSGRVPGEVVLVVSNRADAFALERARRHGIESACLARDRSRSREAYDAMLADRVGEARPDLVVLAGFMHVLSPAFLQRFRPDTIVNLHPALLPDDPGGEEVVLEDGTRCPVFRGIDAPRQALAAGGAVTGTSVHFVTAEVDRGPIVARERVPIEPGDTLEALVHRIQAVEHRLLPDAIGRLLRARGFGPEG